MVSVMSRNCKSVRGYAIPLSVSLMMVLLSIASILIPAGAVGLTVTSDHLSEDTRWALSDSPVTIENNLTVDAGFHLTIDPGVQVLVAEDCWIEVKGRMEAIGTGDLPITFGAADDSGFERINISDGGEAVMEFCEVNSTSAIMAQGPSSMIWIYNSTLETGTYGLSTSTGATIWAINCTFNTMFNVSVSGGTIHEGNWFTLKAIKDINGDPVINVDIVITATVPAPPPNPGQSWTIYDSLNYPLVNPSTGADGTVPPIPVEQYLHQNIVSSTRAIIQIKINDSIRSDLLYPVYMGADLYHLWEMDFTPPEAPVNLTVIGKGGNYIWISWDYEGDPMQVKFFTLSYKKWWEEAEEDWDILEPGPSSRDWNISTENPPNSNPGLVEEMEYDIKISCIDGADNPSKILGPIRVKTLDVTPPESPEMFTEEGIGGHYINLLWNRSETEDVIGYDIFVNDTNGDPLPFAYVESTGEPQQSFNLTGLANETEFNLWIAARDDGEVPNLSDLMGPLSVKTLDITPPVVPILEVVYLDPEQYIEGSSYYNNTQIGLSGSVAGENRTFIDVFVDDQLYVNPNPDLPRPATFEGSFFFFIHVEEGTHTIKVRSVDSGGNKGEFSEEISVTIDILAPEIGLEIPDSGVFDGNPGTSFVLQANASDNNEVHKVIWNISYPDGDTVVFEGGLMNRGLDEGMHNISLTVIDIAGNMNMTRFSILSLVPDDVLPVATLLSPESSIDLDHAPVFKVRMSEPVVWDLLDAAVFSEDRISRIDLLGDIDTTNLSITFQLTDSLEGGKNYSLVISSIFDLRENEGNDLIFDFSTIEDNRIDTDSDGIPDFFEVQLSILSPSDPNDALLDSDEDGLTNLEEYELGTDMQLKDSDGDNMEDGWEVTNGLSPTDNSDALLDKDSDGYTNLEEFNSNTDPSDPEDKPTVEDDSDPILFIIIGAIVVLVIVAAVIVVIIISRRKEDEEYGEVTDEGDTGSSQPTWSEQESASESECQSCGATIEDGLDYCPICGETIQKDDIVESGSIPIPQPEDEDMDEESLEGPTEEIPPTIPDQIGPLPVDEGDGAPVLDDGIEGIPPPSM